MGVIGVKALLSGGIAPIVQFGANQGVTAAIPHLPTDYLEPVARVVGQAEEFIGHGGGGLLLGIDRQRVNQTDSGGVLFGIQTLVGLKGTFVAGKAAAVLGARLKGAGGTIPRIGGRLPINSSYAGQVRPSGVEFTQQGFPNFRPHSLARHLAVSVAISAFDC